MSAETTGSPIRVLIVDDQAIVRSGLRMILEAQRDMTVVGEAGNGQEGLAAAELLEPDVVLMDIRMPILDGISATRSIVERDPAARVVMLTTYAAEDTLEDALRAGAVGFFAKTDEPADIVAAVRAVAGDQVQLGPGVLQLVLDRYLAQPHRPVPDPADLRFLTDREREVLLLLGRGRTNAEIAGELVIGEATVKTHVSRILVKLALRDRVQAVVYCYEHGLLVAGS